MHECTAKISRRADIIMQLFDDVLGLAGVLALLLDLVAGVHDGGMVALEYLCNIGEGVFKLLPDHVHCHLPRVGTSLERFCEIICSTGI